MRILPFLFICISVWAQAQVFNKIESPPSFTVKKSNVDIVLDGVLDEEAWQRAELVKNFAQYRPYDTIQACGNTEVRMYYTDEMLYISAVCYSSNNDFIVSSLKRDYGFGSSDNISILLDTYNDRTNSFLFGMNAYGARREALISNGGKTRNSFDPSWDNKWYGESKIYEDHWICELAIPFNILRYTEGAKQWRFNAYRNDTQCNEFSIWMNIPREYILMDLNYMGNLLWEEPLGKQKRNISLIPYVNTSLNRNFEDAEQASSDFKFNVGGDAKIALGSSYNLDLTFNPDFSQVEVDRQVTNLDRFEIFFPERRQFFLENADLFGRFGNGRVNPFFSRRIGISQDTVTGNNIQNTIYTGARISGKVNDRLRIGFMSMQTASQIENDLPSYNYSVAAVEQNVFNQSSVAAILVSKQAVNAEGYGTTNSRYDRILGLEYRLRSANNFWNGKVGYMQAITPDDSKHKLSHTTQFEYNRRKYRLEWAHLLIGSGFDAEVGFVPRRDIFLFSPEADIRFFPNNPAIAQHTLSFDSRWIYKLGGDDNEIIEDFGKEEWGGELRWSTRFTNNYNVSLRAGFNNLILLNDFDPTRIQEDDIFLNAGSEYNNYSLLFNVSSDQQQRFYAEFSPRIEEFFGGTRYGFSSGMTYRYNPYGNVSLDINYNHIDLPDPFVTANLWLIGPRFDITFSRSHFLTTFIQYNNQLENISINTRYQWRFAPASDLFLVYSDNYNSMDYSNLISRNRGVVLKLTYWLNV